jgi:tRNA threonylcarbamoyladenosine biosynthesis protein TsaB
VIVLSIDTCDWRGSVAVLEDEVVAGVLAHETKEEYSSWLLPAVGRVLRATGLRMRNVDGYAVAAGPGSFTGVRVGLTSVKAWAEVYGKPVAGVSRLEAFAGEASRTSKYVASFVDAQREQVFGAVYRQDGSGLAKIGEEMVIAPARFVETAVELAHAEKIAWASPDAHLLTGEDAWREREKRGESIERVSATLAGTLGRIGLRRLKEGKTTDALGLDANYVRRSDAEIFWKGGAAHGH